MDFSLSPFFDLYHFRMFDVCTLTVKSAALRDNPCRDPWVRRNPVLVPKERRDRPLPVVIWLSGFSGNGGHSFGKRPFEMNLPEALDQALLEGRAPKAIYVFVDALTLWGGSQFINSEGLGHYEDYIARELVPAIKKEFKVSTKARSWCVAGGSSGGYGALNLASRYPEIFGLVAALAPDSFFEISLLPEIYKVLPHLKDFGSFKTLRTELVEGHLAKNRMAHDLLNVVAMGLCYGPPKRGAWPFQFPMDERSGRLIDRVWRKWKSHDPLEFLPRRSRSLRKWKRVFLEVGSLDQFHLQYGARQIRDLLLGYGVKVDYSEFKGNHFDLSQRRPHIWEWLHQRWQK